MRNTWMCLLLLLAAAPACAQVSYIWSHTDSVTAAPKSFSPAQDLPAFPGDHAHGWAVVTAAWYAKVVAPALEKLPPIPGHFAAASAELNEVLARTPVAQRLARISGPGAAALSVAAARIDATYSGARAPGRWIEGPLEAHVVPDITNTFRQLAPLSIELEGGSERLAVLVYQVEQGQVALSEQPDGPTLPATRYLLVDPTNRDVKRVGQCYLMYIPAMKAYSFSPLMAKRLQAGPIFTGRLERLAIDETPAAPHSAD